MEVGAMTLSIVIEANRVSKSLSREVVGGFGKDDRRVQTENIYSNVKNLYDPNVEVMLKSAWS